MAASTSEELRLLRDSVRAFVHDHQDHRRTRRLRRSLPGHDPSILSGIAELGWLGILLPEVSGGLGLGFTEMAVVLEELERGILGGPVAATAVATRALLHGDNEALKATTLGGAAEGRTLPILAWQDAGSPLSATAVGDGFRLDGTLRHVVGGMAADTVLLRAVAPDGERLFLLPMDTPGLKVEPLWLADDTPAATFRLNRVAAAATQIAASPTIASAALARALDEGAVLAAASMLGIMGAALDMTVDYMKTRVQFGRPIGAFQALQHRAVDLYIQRELAISALDQALAVFDDPAADAGTRRLAASRAKHRASTAVLRITRDAIQLHGAIGFTDEHDIGLYLKRALVMAAWFGNAAEHRRRFDNASAAA